MLSPFAFLPCISTLAFMTPAAHGAGTVSPAYTVVDTGATETSPVLLTPALITPYVTAEKALTAYWAAHPDQAKAAKEHGQTVNIDLDDKRQPGVIFRQKTGFAIPNYPAEVRHDTAVAAIFSKAALDPAHYQPMEQSVRAAIAAVLMQQPADSSVMGRNMAFVQAHRPELATDWSDVQLVVHENLRMRQMIMQNVQQHMSPTGGQGSDLTP